MKLLYKTGILLGIVLVIIVAYIVSREREGLTPGTSPGMVSFLNAVSNLGSSSPGSSPGDSSPGALISDEFCSAINNLSSADNTQLNAALKEMTDPTKNTMFNNNQKQILLGIMGNQAIYQGQFVDIQKKLCAVHTKITQINKKLPKTSSDVKVGTVGTCPFEQAATTAYISIDIGANESDPKYGSWTINAILPNGPKGDTGPKGVDGKTGEPGSTGPMGDRGIRGDWAQKPNPVPENSQNNMGYSNSATYTGGSIY
jgi:hypothetical protein